MPNDEDLTLIVPDEELMLTVSKMCESRKMGAVLLSLSLVCLFALIAKNNISLEKAKEQLCDLISTIQTISPN